MALGIPKLILLCVPEHLTSIESCSPHSMDKKTKAFLKLYFKSFFKLYKITQFTLEKTEF
jgi:hypothetical protein